jgi:exosortase
VAKPSTMNANAIASDVSLSLTKQCVSGLSKLWHRRQALATIWPLGAATLLFGLAYAPNFRDLYSIWDADPNYSHGKLIIPIALVILWRRLSNTTDKPSPAIVPAPWWGWVFLAAILAVRAIAYEYYFRWVETATLVPAIACLTWTFGSWPLLRRVWPAIIFLVFLLPLPPAVNDFIALPLQRIAATGSCFLLQLSGLWAIQDGNVIHLATPHGPMPLDVALACNGLRMLMTMAATITATITLIPLPTWKRITLLFSTVPIAMLSNIIRIVATGWCYYMITGPTAKEWAHDASGLLMMPLALLLVWLELQLLSWLVPDKTADDFADQKRVIPLINEKELRTNASGKDKQKNTDLDELPEAKPKNDDRKVILTALYEKASGKKKQQNADRDDLAKDQNDDRKVILPALYEKASGKKKRQNTDRDDLA